MASAFRSFAFLSVLVSAALAQSSTGSFIPSGISASCSAYLNSLDNNTNFASCTEPFTTTLQQFAPGNATAVSVSSISTILNTLCESSEFSGCPQNTITSQLAAFYAACTHELTESPNENVRTTYDVLYSLFPLREAICSKDDGGNYCATHLANTSSTGNVALVDQAKGQQGSLLDSFLYTTSSGVAPTRRDLSNNSNVAYAPNATTYQSTNILFMFLQPYMSSSALCTTCTRNILTPYITFESSCPYGPGLSNSLLLGGQPTLYNNITSICGASFLSGAVQAAGGLSGGLLSGAAPRAGGQELSAAISAILGVAAFVAAAL